MRQKFLSELCLPLQFNKLCSKAQRENQLEKKIKGDFFLLTISALIAWPPALAKKSETYFSVWGIFEKGSVRGIPQITGENAGTVNPAQQFSSSPWRARFIGKTS